MILFDFAGDPANRYSAGLSGVTTPAESETAHLSRTEWQLQTVGREAHALRVRLSLIETPLKTKMLEHMDELLRLIRYAENEQDHSAER